MKKISITTVYKGFNYGSSLQALASKLFITKLGYDAEIVGYKDSLIKGRDIQFKKLLIIFLRTFWRPNLFKKTFFTYKNSLKKEINEDTKKAFLDFTINKLHVKKFSWRGLKTYAANDDILACLCGSDQIWNATNIYVDPVYYLKFAPVNKRVAYAPSFGKNEIPEYNKELIKNNISKFNYLSVREEQGAKIIKSLINRGVLVLIDPTLLLDKNNWIDAIGNCNHAKGKNDEKYVLLYFLDKPSGAAIKYIERLLQVYKCSVISIPYQHSEFNRFKDCKCVSAGPLEFIDLVQKATFVCTDSFHGMAFSINFNIPFLIFNRIYGTASDQSSRIVSLLDKLELKHRFIIDTEINNVIEINMETKMSFENSNKLLQFEREKAKKYLLDAFSSIEHKSIEGETNE